MERSKLMYDFLTLPIVAGLGFVAGVIVAAVTPRLINAIRTARTNLIAWERAKLAQLEAEKNAVITDAVQKAIASLVAAGQMPAAAIPPADPAAPVAPPVSPVASSIITHPAPAPAAIG
jgi:hypothetical protein